jgi:hypothetical protein
VTKPLSPKNELNQSVVSVTIIEVEAVAFNSAITSSTVTPARSKAGIQMFEKFKAKEALSEMP